MSWIWIAIAIGVLLWFFFGDDGKSPKSKPHQWGSKPTSKGRGHNEGGRFTSTYTQFIRSPQWKAKRLQVLNRDGHRCKHCGCKASPGNWLEVNHKCYPAWGASFQDFVNQPNSQLETLCKKCHDRYTAKTRSRRR